MRSVCALSFVLVAAACATTPPPVWSDVEDQYLCSTVGKWSYQPELHAAGVDELVRRSKARKRFVQTILDRQVKVGMNECEVVAAWGWPHDQNRSHYPWGTHNQMVYRYPDRYVYTEKHVVTSWQE